MPTDADPQRERRDREAWAFAMGTVLVCIAALVIGNKLPPHERMRVDLAAFLLTVLSGTACGYLWWWYTAGDLPMSIRRAVILGGAVVLSVLGCASIAALAVVAVELWGSDVQWLTFVFFWVMTSLMVLQKSTLPLLALMIPWALLWRVVVNRRHAARTIA